MVKFVCVCCGAKVVLGSEEGLFGTMAALGCCPDCVDAELEYQDECARCPGCSGPCPTDQDLCDRCEAHADTCVNDDGTPWYAQI